MKNNFAHVNWSHHSCISWGCSVSTAQLNLKFTTNVNKTSVITEHFKRYRETDPVDIWWGKNHLRHVDTSKTTKKQNKNDLWWKGGCRQIYGIMPMGVMAPKKSWVTSYCYSCDALVCDNLWAVVLRCVIFYYILG